MIVQSSSCRTMKFYDLARSWHVLLALESLQQLQLPLPIAVRKHKRVSEAVTEQNI